MGNSKPFEQGMYIPDADENAELRNGGINDESGATLAKNVVAANITASAGTYNLTSTANRALNVFFSQDNGSTYKKITFTGIVGVTPAATTAAEIAALLNANTVFSQFFLAINNAGTLEIQRKLPSSRFKTYFTGTLAAVLGTDFTTAIAPGSAVAAGTNAGLPFEFTMLDQIGNPIVNGDVYLYNLVSGSASATSGIGLISKGQLIGDQAQYNGAQMKTDLDGKIAGYVTDTANEAVVVTARPLHGTSKMAVALQGTKTLTFT